LLGSALVLTSIVSASTACAAPLFSLTPIPVAPFQTIGGNALNDAGHAVGIGDDARLGFTAYYWSPETGLVSGPDNAFPNAINNHDLVVGSFPLTRGFTWDAPGGAARDVTNATIVTDANDAGQIVYRSESGGVLSSSYVRDADGTVRQLADLGDPQRTFAGKINASGDVVGYAFFTSEGQNRAVYWPAAGAARRLPDLPGVHSTGATDINNVGQVVGDGATDPGTADPLRRRALLWDLASGNVRDLGTLPGELGARALAINDAGDVVGGSGPNPGAIPTRAFLWTAADGMLDLTTLLNASGQGWSLDNASAINNWGQVLVTGTFNGVHGAAILTPVPEPAAVAVALLASSTLLRRHRKWQRLRTMDAAE
jgi:probable HAF family extracellular repeat protein